MGIRECLIAQEANILVRETLKKACAELGLPRINCSESINERHSHIILDAGRRYVLDALAADADRALREFMEGIRPNFQIPYSVSNFFFRRVFVISFHSS